MRRVISLLIVAAIVVAVAWWIAQLPGDVTAQFGGYAYTASIPVTILLLVALFGLLYLVLRLIGGAIRLPRRVRLRRQMRDRRLGDDAVTRALVALAAGDGSEARREAGRARRLLGDTPQTLLLAAQAAAASGREDEATEALDKLAQRQDAAFLGWRGLLRQAIAREDWPKAAEIARRAEEAHPGAAWLRAERARLALRTGAWKEALLLSGPDADNTPLGPSLATAAAEVEPDAAEARRLARQAFETDPTLTPAALAYARRLREAGREGRAEEVLRRAWAANPHPDIAAAYLASAEGAEARLRAAERLVKANPDHVESQLLLGRLALEAGRPEEARRHAEAAHAAGLEQRRLYVLLADIAEAEGNSEAAQLAQRDALRHAAVADPDPTWRCQACGTDQTAWHPTCPTCHTPGRIAWMAPAAGPHVVVE